MKKKKNFYLSVLSFQRSVQYQKEMNDILLPMITLLSRDIVGKLVSVNVSFHKTSVTHRTASFVTAGKAASRILPISQQIVT